MSETGAAGPLYRLIAHVGPQSRVHRGRNFASLTAAHQGMSGAVRGERGAAISAVEIQRGLPAAAPCIDPYAVVPGVRGGWSAVSWETIERFDCDSLAALRGAVERARPASSHRSQRPIMVAGLAAILVCTSALFGLQTGGAASGSAAGAENTRTVTELPITRAEVDQATARAEPNEATLRRSIESALSGAPVSRADADQPPSSW